MEKFGNIANVRSDHFLVFLQRFHDIIRIKFGFVVKVFQQNVFLHADTLHFVAEFCFVQEKLLYLEADLSVFIGIERRDPGLGGAECLACQTFFFAFIKEDVIRHQDLSSVGNQDLRHRNALADDVIDLPEHIWDVESNTVSQDACCMIVKYAGRQHMKSEFAIIVLDGVAGIASSLKPDDDVGFLRKHIRDLTFSFIAPVGAYDSFDHV